MTNPADTTDTAAGSFPTGTWRIDAARTVATVTVKKLGLFTVPAALTLNHGAIEIDADGRVASATAAFDAGSYASKNAKRNTDVIGAKLLDADRHPTLGFVSDSVQAAGDTFRAEGHVAVKGVDHPATVTISDLRVRGDEATFTATSTLDRMAIGVDAMKPVIGRQLHLAVDVVARRS